jgi:hypothetical protein
LAGKLRSPEQFAGGNGLVEAGLGAWSAYLG